jgi:hypothetical protein
MLKLTCLHGPGSGASRWQLSHFRVAMRDCPPTALPHPLFKMSVALLRSAPLEMLGTSTRVCR